MCCVKAVITLGFYINAITFLSVCSIYDLLITRWQKKIEISITNNKNSKNDCTHPFRVLAFYFINSDTYTLEEKKERSFIPQNVQVLGEGREEEAVGRVRGRQLTGTAPSAYGRVGSGSGVWRRLGCEASRNTTITTWRGREYPVHDVHSLITSPTEEH